MALIEVDWKPSSSKLRGFSILGSLVFGGLGIWLWSRHAGAADAESALGMLLPIMLAGIGAWCLVGIAVPPVAKPVYVGLIAITLPIGLVVSTVILILIYYGIFLPIGIVMKLIGRDTMQRCYDPAAKTYWVPRGPGTDRDRCFRQY